HPLLPRHPHIPRPPFQRRRPRNRHPRQYLSLRVHFHQVPHSPPQHRALPIHRQRRRHSLQRNLLQHISIRSKMKQPPVRLITRTPLSVELFKPITIHALELSASIATAIGPAIGFSQSKVPSALKCTIRFPYRSQTHAAPVFPSIATVCALTVMVEGIFNPSN